MKNVEDSEEHYLSNNRCLQQTFTLSSTCFFAYRVMAVLDPIKVVISNFPNEVCIIHCIIYSFTPVPLELILLMNRMTGSVFSLFQNPLIKTFAIFCHTFVQHHQVINNYLIIR